MKKFIQENLLSVSKNNASLLHLNYVLLYYSSLPMSVL